MSIMVSSRRGCFVEQIGNKEDNAVSGFWHNSLNIRMLYVEGS